MKNDPYYDPDDPQDFRSTRLIAQELLVERLLELTKQDEIPDPPELADVPHWLKGPYETEPEVSKNVGASSQQPAASSQQPAASSQQPAASSQQPAASSQQPAASS